MCDRVAEKLRAGEYDSIPEITQLERSLYYTLLLNAFDNLQTKHLYRSHIHGVGHVERVMLLGAIIAMQQGFSTRETELLLYACSYHDVGRIDDHRDDQHGKRSADALPSIPGPNISKEEMSCIQAAVATHSKKDEKIEVYIEKYHVPAELRDLSLLLCKGLKDADNLDRVRIHDLDIKHLRFEESKRMKSVAEAVFRT